MKRFVMLFFLLVVFISLNAIWKYEQEANPNGVDVKFGVLAEDWICTETGPISKICFAHSWKDDVIGTITGIWVNIYDDNSGVPGSLIFTQYVTIWHLYEYSGVEAWYDPYTSTYLPNNHNIFRKCEMVINPPFIQTFGTHYWLSIIPIVAGSEEIGWKTSFTNPFNNAVYLDTDWETLLYSGLAFKLGQSEDVCPVELSSFTAVTTVSNQVELKWVTQSETNLLGYNIMRSITGNASDAVCCNSNVIASNNSSTEQIYSFTDNEAQTQTSYWYWLESVEIDGITEYHGPVYVTVGSPSDPETPPVAIEKTTLHDAYPNPFGSSTKIAYDISSPANVKLEVYNLKGEKVRTLEHINRNISGTYTNTWDGLGDNGKVLSSGIYLYRLQTDNFVQTKRAILLK